MNYKEERPWGWFEILIDEPAFKVKRILVQPKKRLSLQSHKFRSENWIIARGTALITLDSDVREYGATDSVFIKAGTKHRIENSGENDVVFIEVQTGTYFGEDDIVRYEDDFNRI